jgi:hypothetical protein
MFSELYLFGPSWVVCFVFGCSLSFVFNVVPIFQIVYSQNQKILERQKKVNDEEEDTEMDKSDSLLLKVNDIAEVELGSSVVTRTPNTTTTTTTSTIPTTTSTTPGGPHQPYTRRQRVARPA